MRARYDYRYDRVTRRFELEVTFEDEPLTLTLDPPEFKLLPTEKLVLQNVYAREPFSAGALLGWYDQVIDDINTFEAELAKQDEQNREPDRG